MGKKKVVPFDFEKNKIPKIYEDAKFHVLSIRIANLMKNLGYNTEEQQTEFMESTVISAGYPTLEWAHGTPPPFHTYAELPLIKEPEN